MNDELQTILEQLNPWFINNNLINSAISAEIERAQTPYLLAKDWDHLWLILIGPRQAGKTTIGKYLCQKIIQENRYENLLYLNCDFHQIRQWLSSTAFLKDATDTFDLDKPFILFIDEVQRLESPGLFLKTIIDLKPDIKLITSGSSQLEIKSKVSEFLTGRKLESTILPLSCEEIPFNESTVVYGSYPDVYRSEQKQIILSELFETYIKKDIVEILKMQKPDVIQKLISLLAHSSGQLLNYNQLATDCQVSANTIKSYINTLEQTFVIKTITPFVGNKRKEITSNPVAYFIDNGFRNTALGNFNSLSNRQDTGLLVENAIFSELFKWINIHRHMLKIHYWRTRSGAEVDFILTGPNGLIIPIEVKYRSMSQAQLTRSFHSFIEVYEVKNAFFVTKDFNGSTTVNGTEIQFISLRNIHKLFNQLTKLVTS